ncbi:S8 family serine peptidase [Dyadobacter sp. CY345]|uniref:S8 family serine peptidase n=1 Tax=Dyadobacter sp. CY345 TaxID=2909335 RepID=UPI001F175A88|nr:S8 family serine peptidase [Dyadobacter sp. CY345]MCF2445033.1 S8 family serine peptidase [Dyadobacter sp. CY345]
MSGTSMPCPHVAGLAALVASKKPNATFGEVRDIIKNNVDAITPDKPIGTGRVNAFKSVRSALAIKTGPNTYYYNFRGNECDAKHQ